MIVVLVEVLVVWLERFLGLGWDWLVFLVFGLETKKKRGSPHLKPVTDRLQMR